MKYLTLLVVFLPLLTACGGDEDDTGDVANTNRSTASTSESSDLCGLAVLFLANPADVCTSSSSSSSSGSSSSAPPPPPSPEPLTGPIHILSNMEFEPNNAMANANSVTFATSDGRVGFKVEGSVDDRSDLADTFTFARHRAADFNLQICPPGEMICEATLPIDTDTVFFEVLDQAGQVLKSSADDETNFSRFRFEAGLVYYVRVVPGDTMGARLGYTLTVYETN